MSKRSDIKDVLELFRETVSPEEIISATLNAKISSDIARIRIAKGLSQKDFAQLIGVSQGRVSRLESGTDNYTIGTLAKIVAACNLNIHISISDPEMTPKSVTVLNDVKEARGLTEIQKYTHPYNFVGTTKEG